MAVLETISMSALRVIIIIIAVLFFAVFGGLMSWYLNKKRLQEKYDVIIFNSNGSVEKDKGGIYQDWKTKQRLFFLKKNKVGLKPDNLPYMVLGNKGIVFLIRTGVKSFQYVKIKPRANELTYEVGQEDVNWAKLEIEKSKKTFTTSLLMQLLPFLSVALASMIILIMVIYILKRFDVLKDVALVLKETAQILQQAKVGTAVIPS